MRCIASADQDGSGRASATPISCCAELAAGFSGGTVASMMELMRTASGDPEARRLLNDPYTLTTERGAEPELGPQPDIRGGGVATSPLS